jgi:hypothetical protein
LQQRLLDGGTIYACPGRYQGNFIMATARLIGAGSGDNPATATILDAAGTGRVIALGSNVTAELMSVRITGGKVPQYSGGGVLAQDGDLRMTNCAVVNNEASQGGGLYVSGAFRLTNSTVSGNTAFTGGGFRLQGTAAKFITDSVISGNTSTNLFGDGGGGILTAASTLSIIGTEISGNSANEKGGGIENISGAITMNAACRLLNNVSGDGGAIYTYPEGSVALNGATVTGNSEPQCKGMTC